MATPLLCLAQTQWQSIGPWGGDRHCISMDPSDPQTLYVGGAGGFVHKSSDSGRSWTPLAQDTLKGSLSVEAIVVHPDSSHKILCNASPMGMYRSLDSGKTWQQTNSGLSSWKWDAADLLVDPNDPNTVYAGMHTATSDTGYGGVYVSHDFGSSWSPMNDSLALTTTTRLAADKTGRIYASTFGEGLYYFNPDSARWFALSNGLPDSVTAIEVHPQNKDTLIAGTYENWLYRSVNRGQTWNALPEPSGMGSDTAAVCWVIEFDPQNPSMLWTRTENTQELPFYPWSGRDEGAGTHYSTDGGDSWSTAGAGFTDLVIDSSAPLTNDAYPDRSSIMYRTGGGGAAISKSSDGGISYDPIVEGINGVFINYVEKDRYGRVFSGAEKGFEITRDGGNSWKQIQYFNTAGQWHGYKWDIEVDPQDSSILYCAKGEFHWASGSTGKGLFRAELQNDSGVVLNGTDGYGIWRVDCGRTCDTLYIGTQSQGVWKSVDQGNSWDRYKNGLDELSVPSFYVSPQKGLMYCATRTDSGEYWGKIDPGEKGAFYYWDQGSQVWQKRTNGMGGDHAISDIAVDPEDESIVYASTFAHGIYKSTDSGSNWTKISEPATEKVYALALDTSDTDRLFAGTASNGVFATFDGGISWQSLNGPGLTNVRINDIALDPSDPDRVYAATLGGSIFTTDLSATGISLPQGNGSGKGMKVHPNPFRERTRIRTEHRLEDASFFLYDSHGQLVMKRTGLTGQEILLNRKGLEQGTYFSVIRDEERTLKGKLVLE